MPAGQSAPAARPGTRRRLSAARRRDLLLQAAAGVFAEQGYHGASMTAIAAAAGIAPSVIYDHFSSKKDLHLELLARHARAMVEATTRVPAAGSGEELVRRSTEAFFSYVEQNRYACPMPFRDPPAAQQIPPVPPAIHHRRTPPNAA